MTHGGRGGRSGSASGDGGGGASKNSLNNPERTPDSRPPCLGASSRPAVGMSHWHSGEGEVTELPLEFGIGDPHEALYRIAHVPGELSPQDQPPDLRQRPLEDAALNNACAAGRQVD